MSKKYPLEWELINTSFPWKCQDPNATSNFEIWRLRTPWGWLISEEFGKTFHPVSDPDHKWILEDE